MNGKSSILSLLDGPLSIKIEEEWDDYAELSALIADANKAFSLLEYLDSKYSMQVLVSNNGWTHKMSCPFHKHGHERTPSFFVNPRKNRFYCQACGATGGLVEFISLATKQPEEFIAEHIINTAKSGGIVLASIENERKLEEKRKIAKCLFQISDLFRIFIHSHFDDEVAMQYIDKLMSGFDIVHSLNQEDTESNIEEILENFKSYIIAYDRKVA